MTDESAAPPAPDPIKPAAGPRPPGARPPVRKSAPPPPAKPRSDVKKWLVLGIIGSSVILIGLIGWRVAVLLTKKPSETRNVKGEWENAWQSAVLAHKEMFGLQAKAWVKNEALTDEEMGKFKAGLATLQKTSEKYHDLMALLREKNKLDSQEANDMNSTQIRLKTWVWDANGMIDPAAKGPKYGGLYVPMYSAVKQYDDATKRLKERSEEHTSELQSQSNLVCRLLHEKKKSEARWQDADGDCNGKGCTEQENQKHRGIRQGVKETSFSARWCGLPSEKSARRVQIGRAH